MCRPGDSLPAAMAAAVAATRHAAAVGGSQVATLVVPHDMSWERSSSSSGSGAAAQQTQQAGASSGSDAAYAVAPGTPVGDFIQQCAAALKACPRGKAALLISGRATLQDGEHSVAAAGAPPMVDLPMWALSLSHP